MHLATIEDQLAKARREIERLQAAVAARPAASGVDDDDWPAFAAAVESELCSWDTYVERLQADVAVAAWEARERAEAAIADARSRRIALGESLAQTRAERPPRSTAGELSANVNREEQR